MNLRIKASFFIICSLFFLSSSFYINKNISKPAINITKQDSAINLDSKLIAFFSAGNKRLIADLLWITTLLESDLDHYKGKDLNSWMYLRFHAITYLDPLFLRAYSFGGKYLSIIKDDISGAEEILNKGIEYYPDSYDLHFDLGFLYAFETAEAAKAIKHYEKILYHPKAPQYLKTLLSRLKYEDTQDLSLTFQIVMDIYRKEPKDSTLRSKLEVDLYAIKAEIDLDCLNSGIGNCSQVDFNGDRYIQQDGNYTSQKQFKKYQVFRKKREP